MLPSWRGQCVPAGVCWVQALPTALKAVWALVPYYTLSKTQAPEHATHPVITKVSVKWQQQEHWSGVGSHGCCHRHDVYHTSSALDGQATHALSAHRASVRMGVLLIVFETPGVCLSARKV